jgi:hypothetical protein
MKKDSNQHILYSPSDLVTYLESPFASWMQRMYVEGVEGIKRDEESGQLAAMWSRSHSLARMLQLRLRRQSEPDGK